MVVDDPGKRTSDAAAICRWKELGKHDVIRHHQFEERERGGVKKPLPSKGNKGKENNSAGSNQARRKKERAGQLVEQKR